MEKCELKATDSNAVAFQKKAIQVSEVSIAGNVLLSLLKLVAGIWAHSSAMVSDAVHSASDVFSSVVVIIGVKLASKESDEDHPYGHERLECVAAVVLAFILGVTGLFIGKSAFDSLMANDYKNLPIPGVLALVAAVISILVKEGMYWYTRYYAKKIDSNALMADAWHHRSDALSSVGSLIGVAGARMGYAWLDPFASVIICLFILKAAFEIFVDATKQMVDHSCDAELINEIITFAKKYDEVIDVESIFSREFGNRIYVDIVVLVDGNMALKDSDVIAKKIHDDIEKEFPKIKHIMVIMRGN